MTRKNLAQKILAQKILLHVYDGRWKRRERWCWEGAGTYVSAVCKFLSSISSCTRSDCLFTSGKGRVPLGVLGISKKADHRKHHFKSGFGCSLHKIGIVMPEQDYSVPGVESKGSCLENVGMSVRRNTLICLWFPSGAKPLRVYLAG